MNSQENTNPLALENQLCFALYVCSKEVIRKYQPFLEPLGLTYTMYITLLCLWEKDEVSVKDLGSRLFLDSGTLTPVLKKMEMQNLISRTRSKTDERAVQIKLTQDGWKLKEQCMEIPLKMAGCNIFSLEKAKDLLDSLHQMIEKIQQNAKSSAV